MSMIMAHRGARNLWPENSELGFRQVLERGFTAVEFDLHLTDDGAIVVMHDASLDRTTDRQGLTRHLSDDSRKTLRLRGEDGRLIDEGVMSFDELLDLFQPYRDVRLYVELKADETYTPYAGLVAKVIAALRARGMADRACLHSFDLGVVAEIRDLAPEVERMVSVDRVWADKQGGLDAFIDAASPLVDVIGIHHALFEAELPMIREKLGVERCSVWTLNDPALIRRIKAIGPKWMVSDDPVLLRDILNEAR